MLEKDNTLFYIIFAVELANQVIVQVALPNRWQGELPSLPMCEYHWSRQALPRYRHPPHMPIVTLP